MNTVIGKAGRFSEQFQKYVYDDMATFNRFSIGIRFLSPPHVTPNERLFSPWYISLTMAK